MQIHLGLGSNLGERREHLRRALGRLDATGIRIERVSPVVESQALLPDDAPPEWRRPYLNLAVECRTDAGPEAVRARTGAIERELGRAPGPRWSPRPVDIDILLWGELQVHTESLTVPHPGLYERNFVLTPLVALQPRLVPPGSGGRTLLDCSRDLSDPIPLWMGIVNVTPDSFSDGGRLQRWEAVARHVGAMLDAGVHMIDVGGESTRPGAVRLSGEREWARLAPILDALLEWRGDDPLAPRIGVDTYRAETARRALRLGVDTINDVGGLESPAMIELAGETGADWIAMHRLSLPVDPGVTLGPDADAVRSVEAWLLERAEQWDKAGLDPNRIIVDPGIGFGKTPSQSLDLVRRAGALRRHGFRVLVGHSRKSFLKSHVGDDPAARDLATAGLSLQLSDQGVDILRVHDVPLNVGAYRGWTLARRKSRRRTREPATNPAGAPRT